MYEAVLCRHKGSSVFLPEIEKRKERKKERKKEKRKKEKLKRA